MIVDFIFSRTMSRILSSLELPNSVMIRDLLISFVSLTVIFSPFFVAPLPLRAANSSSKNNISFSTFNDRIMI